MQALPRPHHLPTIMVVAGIHLCALVLLLAGHAAGAVPFALAGFAYTRGLMHAMDADHLCMIDGSTRKLLGESHNPNGVGLAFSLGHSTVVLVAGAAVASGAQWVRTAMDPDSQLGSILGLIGATVSATYLLAVAAANIPNLTHHHNLQGPRGPWARILTRPLSRVRHAGHIYLFGILFGLGFDTASTIGLLMMTALATSAGTSSFVLMALPVSFTAAMSLGDSINAQLMLRVYTTAAAATQARFNTVITAVSISCAVIVAAGTATDIASQITGRDITSFDTAPIGWALVTLAVLGSLAIVLARRLTHAGVHTHDAGAEDAAATQPASAHGIDIAPMA